MLNLEEMVISLKTQGYGGGRRRTPMGDGVDLFLFMTRRFRMGSNGWKPGCSFELIGKNLPFNRAIHPKLGSGVRRERVVFLEKFKQNRCPLMLLPVLRLCDSTGKPSDGSHRSFQRW